MLSSIGRPDAGVNPRSDDWLSQLYAIEVERELKSALAAADLITPFEGSIFDPIEDAGFVEVVVEREP